MVLAQFDVRYLRVMLVGLVILCIAHSSFAVQKTSSINHVKLPAKLHSQKPIISKSDVHSNRASLGKSTKLIHAKEASNEIDKLGASLEHLKHMPASEAPTELMADIQKELDKLASQRTIIRVDDQAAATLHDGGTRQRRGKHVRAENVRRVAAVNPNGGIAEKRSTLTSIHSRNSHSLNVVEVDPSGGVAEVQEAVLQTPGAAPTAPVPAAPAPTAPAPTAPAPAAPAPTAPVPAASAPTPPATPAAVAPAAPTAPAQAAATTPVAPAPAAAAPAAPAAVVVPAAAAAAPVAEASAATPIGAQPAAAASVTGTPADAPAGAAANSYDSVFVVCILLAAILVVIITASFCLWRNYARREPGQVRNRTYGEPTQGPRKNKLGPDSGGESPSAASVLQKYESYRDRRTSYKSGRPMMGRAPSEESATILTQGRQLHAGNRDGGQSSGAEDVPRRIRSDLAVPGQKPQWKTSFRAGKKQKGQDHSPYISEDEGKTPEKVGGNRRPSPDNDSSGIGSEAAY